VQRACRAPTGPDDGGMSAADGLGEAAALNWNCFCRQHGGGRLCGRSAGLMVELAWGGGGTARGKLIENGSYSGHVERGLV